MKNALIRTGVEWIEGIARAPRRPIIAGALTGIVSGIAFGAFTGPVGALLGMWMGVFVGLVMGYVIARDDETQSVRTRELDAIIGITDGSMGAGKITIPSEGEDAEGDAPPPYSSKEAWLSEWLTPPPPVAG
jgi:hypothetical protein